MDEQEAMLTTQGVADLLKVDLSTVNRWCRNGQLRSLLINPRVRRIRPSDLEDFLAQAKQRAEAAPE